MSYLRGTGSGHPNHAGLGALYVHRLWWRGRLTRRKGRRLQLISLCIYGHHTGFAGLSVRFRRLPYLNGLREQPENDYREAVANFYVEVATEEELDEPFAEAYKELKNLSWTAVPLTGECFVSTAAEYSSWMRTDGFRVL